jgi:tight adherence protein C
MAIVVLTYLLTVILLVFSLIAKNFEKERKKKERIDSYVQLKDPKEEEALTKKKETQFIIKDGIRSLTKKLRDYYNDTMPSKKEEELQKKLLRAGNPFRMTVADYYIINTIVRVAVPLLFFAYALLLKLSTIKIIILVFIGFSLSFVALDYYINLKTNERYRKALRELPDFLDILTISVEAGLGFDLALSKTIEKRKGILPFEFNTCLEEMRLGKTRKEALSNLKDRLGFDEIVSFINSVIQSERLGTGIVQTLRTKSEDERDKRKQRAEEQAMKTSIKILFPLVLFIFPSIFIIIFGPVVMQIVKIF